jgi:hypothetical protein
MDPYLEAPDVWPDFHGRLAEQISGELNRTLPRQYYARLAMRPEIGIVGGDEPRRIIPDVAVVRTAIRAAEPRGGGLAVADRPRAELSPSVRMRVRNEPLRHHFVAYDRGPYARGAVDYCVPPDPPVRPELADWLTGCLDRWRSGVAAPS